MSVKETDIVKRFLEELYPNYQVDLINMDRKTDGYDIEAQMKERFNPSKRYHASISILISIVEF